MTRAVLAGTRFARDAVELACARVRFPLTRVKAPLARVRPPPGARLTVVAATADVVVAATTGVVVACGAAPPDPAPSPVPPRIVIDGRFDEWGACAGIEDPADAPEAELDLREVCLAADPETVYLRLDLGRPVNAQGLDGILSLALDVDGDPSTGWQDRTVSGIDLIIEFTYLDPNDPQVLRYGVRAFVPDPAAPADAATALETLDPYEMGLIFEPRHTARRIEVRLDRGIRLPNGVHAFGDTTIRGRVAYAEGTGRIVDTTGPFASALGRVKDLERPTAPPGSGQLPLVSEPLGRAPGAALRVLSWNVSRARFLADPEPFRRILTAVVPDLVLLDEITPDVTFGTIREILRSLPAANGWFVHIGSSGSAQRQAIAARWPLESSAAFSHIPYPDSALALLRDPTGRDLREVRANAVRSGVPAAGAWLSLQDRRILVATLDLVCCGNRAGAIEDRIRRIEAGSIHGAAHRELGRAAEEGQPADGVIVGGDFNLVASRTPLDLIAAGLGPGGTDLVAAYALQLDGRTSATWDGGHGQFPPGQLDYLLYSGSTLHVSRAFVFETLDLSPEWLEHYGLDVTDSHRASDHRPIVVDLSWGEPR